jgi:SAM-dependent methyltransferase
MAAQKRAAVSGIRSWLCSYLQLISFFRAVASRDLVSMAEDAHGQFLTLKRILEPYDGQLKQKVILDIGCGRFFPTTLLLHSCGNSVIGIDTAYIGLDTPFPKRWWKSWVTGGFYGFAREAFLDLSRGQQRYYRILQDLVDFPLVFKGLDIRLMNAERLEVPDSSVDVGLAIDVFEHISAVGKAVAELNRVLKPRGIAYVRIHLFSSVTGGHLPQWKDPEKVPPWGHLRGKGPTAPVRLNGLRKGEYLSLFKQQMDVLQVLETDKGVGQDLLTPEIRSELQQYSEEELLTTFVGLVVRRRGG